MFPAVFELKVSASEWPQTHALECAATGIGGAEIVACKILCGYQQED